MKRLKTYYARAVDLQIVKWNEREYLEVHLADKVSAAIKELAKLVQDAWFVGMEEGNRWLESDTKSRLDSLLSKLK